MCKFLKFASNTRNFAWRYCGIQKTTKPYTEQSFDSASLSKDVLSKSRPPQQRKIAQSMCKRLGFLLQEFYSIGQVSFHIIQKNANLTTLSYFCAKSEFIKAAQTFSSLRIAKCGLELTMAIHWTYCIWSQIWKALERSKNFEVRLGLLFWRSNCAQISVPTILRKLEESR